MESPMIPQTFEQWKYCIEVECRLELTASFIDERIASLQNNKDLYTQQFLKLYGQEHFQRVLGWFKQARESV